MVLKSGKSLIIFWACPSSVRNLGSVRERASEKAESRLKESSRLVYWGKSKSDSCAVCHSWLSSSLFGVMWSSSGSRSVLLSRMRVHLRMEVGSKNAVVQDEGQSYNSKQRQCRHSSEMRSGRTLFVCALRMLNDNIDGL